MMKGDFQEAAEGEQPQRVVLVSTKADQLFGTSAATQLSKLSYQGNEPITLVIGEDCPPSMAATESLLSTIRAVQARGVRIDAVGHGLINASGALLLAASDTRQLTDKAVVNMEIAGTEKTSFEKIKEAAAVLTAHGFGTEGTTWVSAQDLVKNGFAQEIQLPKKTSAEPPKPSL